MSISPSSEFMVEVTQVNHSFRTGFWMKQTPVLQNVTLKVPKKSVFGFIGANGAGKSTLISLMVGLRKPTSGQVRVNGLDAMEPAAKSRLGYLPERPYFHEHLTGEGLLRYFGALSGMSHDLITARIPQVLEVVNMSHAVKTELKKYSKGMLQRIGIAQAILHDPEFLVLDEPMSGLDPIGRKEVRELIIKLASEGKTIFFSTHVIPDVEAICDQVALIQKGKIVGTGAIGDFIDKDLTGTEIVFSGITPEVAQSAFQFASVRQNLDSIRAILPPAKDLGPVLQGLLQKNAKIHSVTPMRPSLENFFILGAQS